MVPHAVFASRAAGAPARALGAPSVVARSLRGAAVCGMRLAQETYPHQASQGGAAKLSVPVTACHLVTSGSDDADLLHQVTDAGDEQRARAPCFFHPRATPRATSP